ncbi:MAG: TetR/AcrR family transcriptional regulator [Sneathiellales bacterium]|nr:TetR/AcrR family transcriptional regulator [Sneathiellales bacterium]
MPWEKGFKVEEAVTKAQKVFWSKGYEATSLSDLTEGMGINKGSLYNAFGNKKKLFMLALLQYDRDNGQKTVQALSKIEDPVEAITTLFDGLVAQSIDDRECKGCFLVNTALELPHHEEDIQKLVISALEDIEGFFKSMILKGQKVGRISKDIQADETAKSLLSFVVGLRVLARGVFDEKGLHAIRDNAVRLIDN